MNNCSIGLAGGEWPYLSFRNPVGYGGVEPGFAFEQIYKAMGERRLNLFSIAKYRMTSEYR